MQECQTDLWEVEADARVITTNGTIRKDGKLVMGRGCAREAKYRFPGLDKRLGERIRRIGLQVMRDNESNLVAFPVKYNYYELADLGLIYRSLKQLVIMTDVEQWATVVLPRPGCGNGGRSWGIEVGPIVRLMLDDRFIVVHRE